MSPQLAPLPPARAVNRRSEISEDPGKDKSGMLLSQFRQLQDRVHLAVQFADHRLWRSHGCPHSDPAGHPEVRNARLRDRRPGGEHAGMMR